MTDPEAFRDRIATVDAAGKRKWIFATKPKGKFYTIRSWVSFGFFALFFTLPFIYVNKNPLFLFNITEAKFIIFGQVFWPQDFFIFGLTMVTFIVFIILFTAAFGRLFCGWVCPQTVFMEMLFRKIEYAIEGNASQQRMLAKAPWNTNKILRKSGKHLAFYLLSFIIANTFLSYIIGITELWRIITEPVTEHIGGFISILVFSGVFYGVYSFFREQICTVICPYGRLQGVLLDKNSMVVAYDYRRGEPRGKFSKQQPQLAPAIVPDKGDCIDCFACVKVCPTGIDIRNGTQMECIGCTACIDACDAIMERINKPLGLVRYASENGIEKKEKLQYTGRMKLYTALLGILIMLLAFFLFTRKEVDATIMRTPGMLFQEVGADSVSNLYNIKVVNKTMDSINLELHLENTGGRIEVIGGNNHVNVKDQGQGSGSFFVILPKSSIRDRKTKLDIGLYGSKGKIDQLKTNFLGPIGD